MIMEQGSTSFLNKQILVTLNDGRTIEGSFQCLDRLKNMILCNVVEMRQDKITGVLLRRKLSQCMISGEHVDKVEIATCEE
mmetsp:Transcript_32701/g.47321  ORF Transcript_32701/g.47321 Transcript_32701/m.47321 type:complete len:81 (-) Transcript_32701:407-649(-)